MQYPKISHKAFKSLCVIYRKKQNKVKAKKLFSAPLLYFISCYKPKQPTKHSHIFLNMLESHSHINTRLSMEQQLMSLAIQTYKITLFLSLPVLLVALIMGLLISIFQATTQINEMTLAFVPKILAVVAMIIFTMPWMLNMLMDFTKMVINMIPTIIS